MKIAFILDEEWDSALTYYGYGVYRALSTEHETFLLCLKDSYIDNKKHKNDKIYIKGLRNKNPVKSFSAFKYLTKKLKPIKPDIVFTILGDATFFACLLKKSLKFKLVRIFGGDKQLRTPRECIDDILLPADFIRSRIDERKINKKIFTIKGFVDTEKFKFNNEGRKRIRDIYGVSDNDTLFGSVGRLDAVKGHKMLIEAFSDLPQNTKLMIIGEEENESVSNLEQIIDNQDLNDRIVIINERRNDITDIMSAFDIGVMSSIGSETIARVIFEFMAIGLPIVTTNVGMLKEIAESCFSIVCNPDKQSLSTAMNNILEKDMENMKKNAIKIAQFYSYKQFSRQILSAINSIQSI